MSTLSTHVLDAVRGAPATGLAVTLYRADLPIDTGVTDADGRVRALGDALEPGDYRLVFDTGAWFAGRDQETFYPEVTVAFRIDGGGHQHVPLLLSPFAYSTYRGS